MLSKLGTLWARLLGGRGGGTSEPSLPAVEYKGCRIRPAPYPAGGQYQTAGLIEKDFAEGIKTHRFIRAETHPAREGAAAFAIIKGKQIIDEQGDDLFDAK